MTQSRLFTNPHLAPLCHCATMPLCHCATMSLCHRATKCENPNFYSRWRHISPHLNLTSWKELYRLYGLKLAHIWEQSDRSPKELGIDIGGLKWVKFDSGIDCPSCQWSHQRNRVKMRWGVVDMIFVKSFTQAYFPTSWNLPEESA